MIDDRTREYARSLAAAAPPLSREIRDRLVVILHPEVIARKCAA